MHADDPAIFRGCRRLMEAMLLGAIPEADAVARRSRKRYRLVASLEIPPEPDAAWWEERRAEIERDMPLWEEWARDYLDWSEERCAQFRYLLKRALRRRAGRLAREISQRHLKCSSHA